VSELAKGHLLYLEVTKNPAMVNGRARSVQTKLVRNLETVLVAPIAIAIILDGVGRPELFALERGSVAHRRSRCESRYNSQH
jgi:hypothetical protein